MIMPTHPALRAACVLATLSLTACSGDFDPHPDLSDVVEKASPSVVNISTVAAAPGIGTLGPGADAPPLDERTPEWFRRFLEEHAPEGQAPGAPGDSPEGPPNEDPQSLGSGFILWEDGYILTNYHVVQGASEVIVRLLDRRQLTARIVGLDERSDLALLKIEASGLPAVKIGDSARLKPGQWVFAIGSPFSFDYSVTAGIVSAKGRSLVSEQYVPFIQTDVAINPGNSGGPLFNMKGEVVGVNSQIYSQNGGFQGVSFSIPIDVAAKVARQLRDTGKVTRGWLGVVVQEVDRNLAQTFKMDKPEGALIARVLPDSPAQETGLRAGDIILGFNGQPLATSSSLPPLVGSVDPGDIVKLDVMREGRRVDFRVQIGVLEDSVAEAQEPADSPPVPAPPPPPSAPLGLVVTAMDDALRRELRVLSGGVRVEQVQDGPALAAGIRTGDVILSLAGQEVDSPQRFAEVAQRLTPGTTVPVLVSREGAPSFIPLNVPSMSSP